ncbi:MAG TPA: nucleotide exchange factor GrpE, partial [Methylomirabilota bacterium]|nr:nucleotide exchange factor GrpE [Methylomirabilota bacterium]
RKETEKYRDRLTRQFQRKFEQRHEALLLQFIDILDNFDRALEASQTAGDSLVEGLILVRTQLLQMLQEEGLERIPVLGLPFDPHVSEAVSTVPVDDPDQQGVVVQEMLRGYRIKGKVARASRVAIGEYAVAAAEVPAPPRRHPHDDMIGEPPTAAPAGDRSTPPAGVEAVHVIEIVDGAKVAQTVEEAVAEAARVVEAAEVAGDAKGAEPAKAVEAVEAVEVLEIDDEPARPAGDSGPSLEEIIARAEALDAKQDPEAEPAKQAILYDDLTELADVDEDVVGAEEGGHARAEDEEE